MLKKSWSLKGYKSKIEASIVWYFAGDMLKLVTSLSKCRAVGVLILALKTTFL